MFSVKSFALHGVEARALRVEVAITDGLPGFQIVGFPEATARESRERVRAALINSGLESPLQRVVVNFSPSSVRRAGPAVDLAIAAALLGASGQLDRDGIAGVALAGELALDGTIRSIPDTVAFAEAARAEGASALAVPAANAVEAALVEGIEVFGLQSLGQSCPWPKESGAHLAPSRSPFARPRRPAEPTWLTCAASPSCATRWRSPRQGGTRC